MTASIEQMRVVAERHREDRDSTTVCLAAYVLALTERLAGQEKLFDATAVRAAVESVGADREKAMRLLRDEADDIEEYSGEDWSPSEVAQELRDVADKIERGAW